MEDKDFHPPIGCWYLLVWSMDKGDNFGSSNALYIVWNNVVGNVVAMAFLQMIKTP